MSAINVAARKPDLTPARFGPIGPYASAISRMDDPMSRLYQLPDTEGCSRAMGLSLSAPEDLAACAAGFDAAGQWFATWRSRACAAVGLISTYAHGAAACCDALQDVFQGPSPAGTGAQHKTVDALAQMKAGAENQAKAWTEIAQGLAQLDEPIKNALPKILALNQSYNFWHISELFVEETRRALETDLKSLVIDIERFQGLWDAMADDLSEIVSTIARDVEHAPEFISSLGLIEAARQWRQIEAVASGQVSRYAPEPIAVWREGVSLGWFRVSQDVNDLSMQLALQLEPDGNLGMGRANGNTITCELLGAPQAGYLRIRFDATGKYLGSEAKCLNAEYRLVEGDWHARDDQAWRPVAVNQASFYDFVISGYRLVQRNSGLCLSIVANSNFKLPPQLSSGECLEVRQRVVLPSGRSAGLQVVQVAVAGSH